MKKLLSIFALTLVTIFVQGCATTEHASGRDFDGSKVTAIVKGSTTSAELEKLLGPPFSKKLINDADTKWMYYHSTGKTKVSFYAVTTKIDNSVQHKFLDVLIRNGVVFDYAYTQGNSDDKVKNALTKPK